MSSSFDAGGLDDATDLRKPHAVEGEADSNRKDLDGHQPRRSYFPPAGDTEGSDSAWPDGKPSLHQHNVAPGVGVGGQETFREAHEEQLTALHLHSTQADRFKNASANATWTASIGGGGGLSSGSSTVGAAPLEDGAALLEAEDDAAFFEAKGSAKEPCGDNLVCEGTDDICCPCGDDDDPVCDDNEDCPKCVR